MMRLDRYVLGTSRSAARPAATPVPIRRAAAIPTNRTALHGSRTTRELQSHSCLRRRCDSGHTRPSVLCRAFEDKDKPPPRAAQYANAVLLQGFTWSSAVQFPGTWYRHVQDRVQQIKSAGFTHVWLPPPSSSVDPQGYMPGQLYDINSKYGSRTDLITLTSVLRDAGITPMADIVINHRCADERNAGVYNEYDDKIDHPGMRIDWGRWAITSNDPDYKGLGNKDTGLTVYGAPDLDHLNPELRAAIKDWLRWLRGSVGFGGWRFDLARGYGAQFTMEYVDATTGAGVLNVGENWPPLKYNGSVLEYDQDAARQELCDWINGTGQTTTAFDFPTKFILGEAIKRTELWRLRDKTGGAPGLLGWWPGMAVTFLDNHDTDPAGSRGARDRVLPFPQDHLDAGYAYLMTHPGIPCVYWDHVYGTPSNRRTNGTAILHAAASSTHSHAPSSTHSSSPSPSPSSPSSASPPSPPSPSSSPPATLREVVTGLLALRRAAGVDSRSRLEVLAAQADMYVARIGGRLVLKLGPQYDMGALLPRASEGWQMAMHGSQWAVWIKA